MRQRITFLQQPQDAANPESITVTKNGLSTTSLKASREDRVTFGLEELPQDLYRVLKASHELHIRWVETNSYDSISPLVSRVSPGLHVFYSPQRKSNSSQLLCPALRKVFGDLDCMTPEESFTTLPTERFSHSSETQYYAPLPNINNLVLYLNHKLCPPSAIDQTCLSRIKLLLSSSTLDIDYDTISHAITLTAFWPSQTWDLDLTTRSEDRLEVGILTVEKPKEPEELSLGGFLTVVGEDTKPSPTLFSFPSRHHPTTQIFNASFLFPSGLHPTLQISISGHEPPVEDRECAMHAHLTLPKAIFADKYQLSSPLFLASKNLSALHYISTPVDLEAPAYTTTLWGSSLLLELSPPTSSSQTTWTAEIPLHLRYLSPNKDGVGKISIPPPVLFWACTAEEGSKFTVNPFDRTNLGYEGLFGPRTMFYHLSPGGGNGSRLELDVPVLDLTKSKYVEVGTAVVIVLGFTWVMWCLFGVWRRGGYSRAKIEEGKKKK